MLSPWVRVVAQADPHLAAPTYTHRPVLSRAFTSSPSQSGSNPSSNSSNNKQERHKDPQNNTGSRPNPAAKLRPFVGIKPKSSVFSKDSAENFEDFAKAEILVGEIVEVWNHPESDKLYCEKIRIGPGEKDVRMIASGLRKNIPVEGMKGKVLVFANLKPRKLAGFQSEGMILCAANKSTDPAAPPTKIEIGRPAAQAQPGERVYLDLPDLPTDEIETVLAGRPHLASPSNSTVENILKSLATDSQGHITFKGKPLRTKSGYLASSTLLNCPVS